MRSARAGAASQRSANGSASGQDAVSAYGNCGDPDPQRHSARHAPGDPARPGCGAPVVCAAVVHSSRCRRVNRSRTSVRTIASPIRQAWSAKNRHGQHALQRREPQIGGERPEVAGQAGCPHGAARWRTGGKKCRDRHGDRGRAPSPSRPPARAAASPRPAWHSVNGAQHRAPEVVQHLARDRCRGTPPRAPGSRAGAASRRAPSDAGA